MALILTTRNNSVCTGTLIAETWALTAAHCVEGLGPNEAAISHGFPNYHEVRFNVKVIPHPQFDPFDGRSSPYDVALVKLESPFLSRTARLASLADSGGGIYLQSGLMTTTTGWGGENALSIRAAEWPLIECPEGVSKLAICTQGDAERYAEGGDSGSPLFRETDEGRVQIGTLYRVDSGEDGASWNRYADLTQLRGWIDDALAAGQDGTVSDPCPVDPVGPVTPPSPPPAPGAFEPGAIEVQLGQHGGTVTLMTTEAGGFTLDGEAFESGGTVRSGGVVYILELIDGEWAARIKP